MLRETQSCSAQNKIIGKRKNYKKIWFSVSGRSLSVNTKYICLSEFGSSFSVNSKAICLSTLFPSIHGSPIVSTEGGAGYLMLSIITTHTSHMLTIIIFVIFIIFVVNIRHILTLILIIALLKEQASFTELVKGRMFDALRQPYI